MYIGPWQEYALSRLRAPQRGQKASSPESPRSQAAGVADLEAIKKHLEQNLQTKMSPEELKQLVDTLSPLVQKTPMQEVYDLKSLGGRPPSSGYRRKLSSGPNSVSTDRSSFSPMPSATFRKPKPRYRVGSGPSAGAGPLTSTSLPDRFFDGKGRNGASTHRSIESAQSTPASRYSHGSFYEDGSQSKSHLRSRSSRGSCMSSQSEPVRPTRKNPNRSSVGMRRRRQETSGSAPPNVASARTTMESGSQPRGRNRPPMDPHRVGHDQARTSYDGDAAAKVLKVARRQKRELIKPDFKSMWKWAKDVEDDNSSRGSAKTKKKKKKKKKKSSLAAKPQQVVAIEKMKKAWLSKEQEKPTAITQEKFQEALDKMGMRQPQAETKAPVAESSSEGEEESSEEEQEQKDPVVQDMNLTEDQFNMVAKYFGGISELQNIQQPQLHAIQESSFDGRQTESQKDLEAAPPISVQEANESSRFPPSGDCHETTKYSENSPPLTPIGGEDLSADALVNWTMNLDIDGII